MIQLPIASTASTRQLVAAMPLERITERAVKLIRQFEPPEGYYDAFSGGKDSVVVRELLEMAGVRYEPWYNNTTIDPPELVRFIKSAHPDAKWNHPKHGNMFYRIATAPKTPPTRKGRWCCAEYKERGGEGRFKVFGVRAEESKARAKNWKEVTRDKNHDPVICPIVYWTSEQVWAFVRAFKVPYCSLYDEGWTRLGCVGCPLNPRSQAREFERWPKYRDAWRRAIIANWERWRIIPNTRTGEPRFHTKFSSGEEMFQWWLTAKHKGGTTCQSLSLWTNEEAA